MVEHESTSPEPITSRIELEPGLTEGEQVAAACLIAINEMVGELDPKVRAALYADLDDIANCETLVEAMEQIPMLEDYVQGDIDALFAALVRAGLIEDVQPGNDTE